MTSGDPRYKKIIMARREVFDKVEREAHEQRAAKARAETAKMQAKTAELNALTERLKKLNGRDQIRKRGPEALNDIPAGSVTEQECYEALKGHWLEHARLADETAEKCFARNYEADFTARAFLADLREQTMVKAAVQSRPDIYASLEPHTVSGEDARSVDDPLAALNALAEAKRKANPKLSREMAFSLVYQDRVDLAMAEREQRLARLSPIQALGNK
jgi:hypothetical protein